MQTVSNWVVAAAVVGSLLVASGCAGSERSTDEGVVPGERGKSDRAIREPSLLPGWGDTTGSTFPDGTSALADTFELFGPAVVEISTAFHEVASPENLRAWHATEEQIRDAQALRQRDLDLDTIVRLYRRRDNGRWARPIASDDDGGGGRFSHVRAELDAGTYRLLVARSSSEGDAIVDVMASCEGTGCVPAPPPELSCEMSDYDCLVGGAVDPLDGPNDRKTRPIDVAELPDAVREPMRAAMREIEVRTMEGTEYTATVVGVFAVFASAGDPTVVAYAVWGSGIDEDYQDGIVVGFDLEGHRVFEIEESN